MLPVALTLRAERGAPFSTRWGGGGAPFLCALYSADSTHSYLTYKALNCRACWVAAHSWALAPCSRCVARRRIMRRQPPPPPCLVSRLQHLSRLRRVPPRLLSLLLGRSKAPDGEYRPTDSKGPPRMTPSLRHRNRDIETSRFSAWKTIRAWVLNENYSIQTGDYTETFKEVASRSICGSSCKNIKIRTQK